MKRDWTEIAMVAAFTNFVLFFLVGFPLTLLFDSAWPGIVIISPVLIGMVAFMVVMLGNEWRRVLRRG